MSDIGGIQPINSTILPIQGSFTDPMSGEPMSAAPYTNSATGSPNTIANTTTGIVGGVKSVASSITGDLSRWVFIGLGALFIIAGIFALTSAGNNSAIIAALGAHR